MIEQATPEFTDYCRLFCQLQSLIASGQDEGAEGEALRDEMDVLWRRLTGKELDRLDALAFDLSRVGGARGSSENVPDSLNKAFQSVLASKDIDGALKFVRENEERLPAQHVSALRGILWADLGQYAPAAIFFSDAIRLDPRKTQLRALWFRSLLKSGQQELARTEALRRVADAADPLELLLAADVLFDSLNWHGGPVPAAELHQVIQLADRGIDAIGEIPRNSSCAAIASSALFSKALSQQILGDAPEAAATASQAEQLVELPRNGTAADEELDDSSSRNGRFQFLQERRHLLHEAIERSSNPLLSAA